MKKPRKTMKTFLNYLTTRTGMLFIALITFIVMIIIGLFIFLIQFINLLFGWLFPIKTEKWDIILGNIIDSFNTY